MRTLLIGMGLLVLLSACNRRKYTEATAYNDAVVSFVEQSDIAMQNWNDNNFMQEYTLRKHNTVMRLLVVQDSLNHIAPLSGDDTLRLSALKIVDNYIETFAVFDTIYAMLSDRYSSYLNRIRIHSRNRLNVLRYCKNVFLSVTD